MYDSPESWQINFLMIGVPFLSYFLGILVRKRALPGPNSPPLSNQLWLGIPMSLVVISPLLLVFRESIHDLPAYLLTVGIAIEHGMIVTETATKQLARLVGSGSS
jgi:hypothetical protein